MAEIRIADLPNASTIDDATFLAIDSYGLEGTCKATPEQVVTPTATNIAQNLSQAAVNALITNAELEELEQMLGIGS